jgi:hypothetical protein
MHVMPVDDVISHEANEDCVCGPRVRRMDTPEGDGWLFTHHSADGREFHETDDGDDEEDPTDGIHGPMVW